MVLLRTAAVAACIAALASPACAEVYTNLGYTLEGSDELDFGSAVGRVGWRSDRFFGVEAEAAGGVRTDHCCGASAPDINLHHQYAAYVTLTAPLTDSFEIFGRAGWGTTNFSYKTTPRFDEDIDSTNLGIGVQYFVGGGPDALRLDYTRMNFSDNGVKDINRWTISWVHKFGMPTK